jgi:hypothetical protein
VRTRRRTISIEVGAGGDLVVRAPIWTSALEVERFMHSRLGWILQKRADAREAHAMIPPLLGPRDFHHRGSVMSWPEPLDHWQTRHRRWERREAGRMFTETVERVIPRFGLYGLRFKGLRLRSMKRRWGSCAADGMITLNDLLVRTPDPCIEAVVTHELCHLVHLDHGPDFKRLMLEMMPEHREADALLDRWSAVLWAETNNGTSKGPVEHRQLTFR